MVTVSFVIPFRSGEYHRRKSFNWIFERLQRWYPEAEILVSDSETESFDRSKARNFGAKNATGEVLVFVDADTFLPSKVTLDNAVRQVAENVVPWTLCYETYFNATAECSEYILKQNPGTFCPSEEEISYDHRLTDSVSGVYLMRTKDFVPYDERFIGWGYEDRASMLMWDTMIGPHSRSEGFVVHLWHPAPEAECFGQPYIDHNRTLAGRYLWAGGDRRRMQALIDERI